jgi:hypothetical protein
MSRSYPFTVTPPIVIIHANSAFVKTKLAEMSIQIKKGGMNFIPLFDLSTLPEGKRENCAT